MIIENEVKNKIKKWLILCNIWRIADYAIVVISFLASITVICVEGILGADGRIIVMAGSIIAATFTMMSFALEPKKHIRGYRKTYAILYEAYVTGLAQCELLINPSYDVDEDDNELP